MSRYPDVHPDDIDPETNRPYAGYSSPALDTSFHDMEMDAEFDDEQYDNDAQDPDGPCMSCPWPHMCAARGGCEAED